MAKLVEPQIFVGALNDPVNIKTQNGNFNVKNWDYRAMWSFLRLQYGRGVDAEIKNFVETEGAERYELASAMSQKQRAALVFEFFQNKIAMLRSQRELQYILEGSDVKAVASLKHLLVPPQTVYDAAELIVKENYPELELDDSQTGLSGLTYSLQEVNGFTLGLQVFGGDIFTRSAISLSSWLTVKLCFNPLSWLGVGGLGSLMALGDRGSSHERLLRIKVLNDLAPRLQQGIKLQMEKTKTLKAHVDIAKNKQIARTDAEVIMAAFGLSYNLGASTVGQVLDRLAVEDPTLWGMSMASSWVARHGDLRSKNPESKVTQKLSTISGAAILLDDIPTVAGKSTAWLHKHIKLGESKTLDDLAEKIRLWERTQK